MIARDVLRMVSMKVIEGVAYRPPLSSDLLDSGRATVYKAYGHGPPRIAPVSLLNTHAVAPQFV